MINHAVKCLMEQKLEVKLKGNTSASLYFTGTEFQSVYVSGENVTSNRRYVGSRRKIARRSLQIKEQFCTFHWITSNLHENTNKRTGCDPKGYHVIMSDFAFAAILTVLMIDHKQSPNL